MKRLVRIGGATAAVNDSPMGVAQFLNDDVAIDYLVFDLLAESVVGRLARQRLDDPDAGFVRSFVDTLIGPNLARIRERGIRVIANAGGVNPHGCAAALAQKAAALGVPVRIAVVDGADLTGKLPEFAARHEMYGQGTLADALAEADPILAFTAYLGAFPIAAAPILCPDYADRNQLLAELLRDELLLLLLSRVRDVVHHLPPQGVLDVVHVLAADAAASPHLAQPHHAPKLALLGRRGCESPDLSSVLVFRYPQKTDGRGARIPSRP
jgi:hypothetical protein